MNDTLTEKVSFEKKLAVGTAPKETLQLPPVRKERLSIEGVFKILKNSARKGADDSESLRSSSSESGVEDEGTSDSEGEDDNTQLSEITSLDQVSSSVD